ncbi:hypothetical protein [Neisseria sp. Ec49-e6-T10]|uniref:hypothetical protein n=1 Tax=Neisseria sp. Ec49-e6-T10 TaxID=3140744 RepID=UPI003EB8D000
MVHIKNEVIVKTKEELKTAIRNKENLIIVEGALAKHIINAKKITTMSKFALAILIASASAIPFTGGASAIAGAVAAGGVSSSVLITAILALGTVMIFAIYKDYNVVAKSGKTSISLERKQTEQKV